MWVAPWRSKRLLATLLALSVVLLLATFMKVSGKRGDAIEYPLSLPGNYTVARLLSGKEAMHVSSAIHWNPGKVAENIKDAIIVDYTDGTRLWATRVRGDACGLVERMAEKIAMHEDRLPYSRPFMHTIGNVTVYFTVKTLAPGVSQLHAFWCKDNLVVWVEFGSSAYGSPERLMRILYLFMDTVR